MKLSDAIRTRRSVKHYDPNHTLTDAELRELLSAAALAPTSFNIHNRQFIAVVDKSRKKQLQQAAFGQELVGDASVVVVIAGDLKSHLRTDRYLRTTPVAVRKQIEPMVADFYNDKDALLRDEACRSVGLAAMNLMLTAKSLGFDSCPMVGFDPVQVSQLIGLDADHPPLMLVAVGKGTQPAWGRMGLLNLEEQVSVDTFGNHSITGEVEA